MRSPFPWVLHDGVKVWSTSCRVQSLESPHNVGISTITKTIAHHKEIAPIFGLDNGKKERRVRKMQVTVISKRMLSNGNAKKTFAHATPRIPNRKVVNESYSKVAAGLRAHQDG